MKTVHIKSDSNWHTVEPKYGLDEFLKIESQDIQTKEGVQLNMSYIMKNVTDIKMNNYSQLVLSDNMRMDKLFSPNLGVDRYPEQFTTYLEANAFPFYTGWSSYVKVIEAESDDDYRFYVLGNREIEPDLTSSDVETSINSDVDVWPTPSSTTPYTSFRHKVDPKDDNGIYYTITLLNENELTVMHDDNYVDAFLTVKRDARGPEFNELYFADARRSDLEDRKFNYYYNPGTGFLSLFKFYSPGQGREDKQYYLCCDLDTTNKRSYLRFKQSRDVESRRIPSVAIFRTKAYKKNTNELSLNNHWVSYSTFGEQNNLNINEKKSYQNIYNNFMFSVPFKTITESVANYNVLQLKNQLTPDYNQSRANPFPFYRDCDHREYDKIFSGTNQIKGTNQLSIGYNSYVTTIELPPDQITYFNTPQDMYPTKRININDSGLIEAGAIGGDTPIVSDKIFKKAADYKYNTPYGAPSDEESGVWLCSWLKTNIGTDWDNRATYRLNVIVNFENKTYKCLAENQNVRPDTDKNTWEKVPGGDPVWVDRYYNPNHYSAQQALKVEGQYYDYTSKFEYIIQKFGAETEYVFDKKSDLTFEPGSLYAYYRIGPNENKSIIDTEKAKLIHEGVTPSYYQNREVNAVLGDNIDLNGTTYIETQSLNKTIDGDFTISFNMNREDWTQPIGSQIVGNYTNQGIGLFNRLDTTPYIVMHDETTVYVYNTDMELVNDIYIQDSNIQIIDTCHAEGSENLHILTKRTDIQNSYTIYQYDIKGMRVEQFAIPNTTTEIERFNITRDCYYIMDTNNVVRKFSINTEKEDLLYKYRKWPLYVVGDSNENDPRGVKYSNSVETYIEPYQTNIYRINCEKYTIDMNGDVWYVKDNDFVYKNITTTTTGKAAGYRTIVNGVLIHLVSTEVQLGETQGNQIRLTGDGVKDLKILISDWNRLNPGNTVESLSEAGERTVLADGESIQLFGGADKGDDTRSWALSGSGKHKITAIKSDPENNIWLLSNQMLGTTLYKMDSDRNIIFTKKLEDIDTSLTPGITGECNMDIIHQFSQGEQQLHACIIMKQSGDDHLVITVDKQGDLVSSKTVNLPHTSYRDITSYNNLTNMETVKRMFPYTNNSLYFKIRYQSYFDTDKTYVKYIENDISDLTTGEHHFSISFNSTNSNLALLIDGQLEAAETSDDVFTGAAYKYSKTIHAPLLVGCDSSFNNIVLSEFLKQQNKYFIKDTNIKDLRVYNKYLSFHKIRALTRENKNIQTLLLTVPTGKRTYIDQAIRYYMNRTPGRKSNYFDINVVSNTLTASDMREILEQGIREDVSKTLPANTYINKVNWIS